MPRSRQNRKAQWGCWHGIHCTAAAQSPLDSRRLSSTSIVRHIAWIALRALVAEKALRSAAVCMLLPKRAAGSAACSRRFDMNQPPAPNWWTMTLLLLSNAVFAVDMPIMPMHFYFDSLRRLGSSQSGVQCLFSRGPAGSHHLTVRRGVQ